MNDATTKPVVLITGAAGGIGKALADSLADDYTVVGLDLKSAEGREIVEFNLTDDDSVELALRKVAERHGRRFASVIHLAAYFDFTGEESPIYDAVNVEGTARLLQQLQAYEVEQFAYSGTMLVHEAGRPGERIDEDQPIDPSWPYPQSKAEAEDAIHAHHGKIPYVILSLAGLYDDTTAVPTLSHQIARIYERNIKSHVYAGDTNAGQAFLHQDDMLDAFKRAVDRRHDLGNETALLIGEPEAIGYQRLQDAIGQLLHGKDWNTISVPKPIAKLGASIESASEPIVPDDFDRGEKPFIRAFMIDLADDHYALDIDRARETLGWSPRHSILDTLPKIIGALKADPRRWYRANGITPPDFIEAASDAERHPDRLRTRFEEHQRDQHYRHIWAPFFNIIMAGWLITSPSVLGYQSEAMAWSDILTGLLLAPLALMSLSWRLSLVRWGIAALGLWLLTAPLIFWAPTAQAYLNGTISGALIFGFAVLALPAPGITAAAALTGPTRPPGWSFTPSAWTQRLIVIALAVVGFLISRYLTAYQLEHIDSVWEPFFEGDPADPKNGTEEVITSAVSEAWPVPDAGLGALTYMLEILTGIIGSTRRWRTMPWLVMLFGILIVPLGIVSITFIIIQPIVIGTYATLTLIAAAAMLIQIPYSLDELIATIDFLIRRYKAGRPILRVFFLGDTDEGGDEPELTAAEEFRRPPLVVLNDVFTGGVNIPWNLGVTLVICLWLVFTRVTLGTEGGMADADHLLGALTLTVTITALAEPARMVRFANIGFGGALLITPFAYGAPWYATISSLICGIALIVLAIPRGPVRQQFGTWTKYIV